MKKLNYITLFVFLVLGNISFSQDDFDVDEYINSKEFEDKYYEDEPEVIEVAEEETTTYFEQSIEEQSDVQQKYLDSEMQLEEFDWVEWQKIKRSIVDGIPESEYTVSEDGYVLEDGDNPFHKSRRQNKSYWNKKRDQDLHRLKRLSKAERKKELERRKKRERKSRSFSFGSGFGTILLILVVVLLAFLIFYMFFKDQENTGKKKIIYDLENISPTRIPKSELELLLKNSLKNEDWREAIRIYFVFTIKSLVERNWIIWEKEKTNFSYLSEMRDNKNYNDFETVVSIYEIVWYGEREITKAEFKSVEPRFIELLQKLGK